jgi:DNA repair exonuclease SbcCD nuclease subunit
VEIVTIGDLHLDALTRYWDEANRLQIGAVTKVIDSEMANGRRHFILLGDLSQGIRDSTGNKIRLSEEAQCLLIELFFKYDGKIKIHVILGNHDFAEQGSHSLQIFFQLQLLKKFKTIHFYDKLTKVVIDGTPVCMVPYPSVRPLKGCDLSFGHYEVNGAIGDSGRKLHSELEPAKTPAIIGHLHTRQKVGNHWYPGTLYQLNFGESLPKGYGIAQVRNGSVRFKWESVDPPFKLINFAIEKLSDLKKISSDKYTLYKLYVPDTIDLPSDFLAKHQNIVNSLQFSNKEELESLQQEELEIEIADETYDHTSYLPNFLDAEGATPWQKKRGLEIIKET